MKSERGINTSAVRGLKFVVERKKLEAASPPTRPLARGVSGCPIADFGHPNIHFFCVYNAMGRNRIGHPIHPKCVFLIPNSEILAKAL